MNHRVEKRHPDGCTIAIIGGGFTGTTLAARLLHRPTPSLLVVLIERNPVFGRGVAYGTRCPGHLLNVPAENMSALGDHPTHFLRWARDHFDSRVKPCDFLPRSLYGDYVESVLREAIRLHPGQFEWRHDEACSITRTGQKVEILLGNGEVICADRVVMALGNFPPGDPVLPGKSHPCRHYIHDVWADDTPDRLTQARCILLVGSGLTSVDVAVAARAHQFKGTIHILSRHGLLPKGHKAGTSHTLIPINSFPSTTRGLLHWVRTLTKEAKARGCDWRSIIDSLRPFTQQIWQSLRHKEQLRFLRHVRPYWEVHRHRLAPEIDAQVASQLSSGQIRIHAGRITAYRENADCVDVTYRDRKRGKLQSLLVSLVLNCTGTEVNTRRVTNPLVKSLLKQKLACPDPLFLGLWVSDDGALIDGNGMVSDSLYAIGPPRKGSLWETTAVPEIRNQISELSRLLLPSCVQKDSALTESVQADVTG